MAISRRKTLSILGGGLIVAAAGGTFAVTRRPREAIRPWEQAGAYAEPRMRALSWAILSPNPHNRQPWKVDLSVPDQVGLYVDTDRLLPHTDPFNRQITIGLGCFLETLALAASQDGLGVEMDLFPQGSDPDALDARPVAIVTFKAGGAEPDPLFAYVASRRSHKAPFDTGRAIPEPDMADLMAAVAADLPEGMRLGGTIDVPRVKELRALSSEALRIETETPRTYLESVDLFRIGHKEVNANPDGITFFGPFFETLHLTGQMKREVLADPNSMAYKAGIDTVLANTNSAMGHIWINTADNSRASQIGAGRAWMRLNLHTTRLGLGTQPLSQALQEYPEMAGLFASAHNLLAEPGETVQMWARLGYSPEVGPTPRWPLDAKVMDA